VVLNSGITYREADYLTNAREVPKPPDARQTGKIVVADFFNELWQVPATR